MTRSPASASENRAHGAEKIGPRRYSDFFNRIGQERTHALQQIRGGLESCCHAFNSSSSAFASFRSSVLKPSVNQRRHQLPD